jgi:hypothetical protein
MAITATPGSARARYTPQVRCGRHRLNRPRTLSLMDLENLLGGDVETTAVRDMWAEFVTAIDLRHDDHTCVAVSRHHAAAAFFGLPGNVQRIIGANGPDGADLALIDAVDYRWIAANFGQVVVASGDHIFAPVAERLRSVGLPVVQVIGAGTSSVRLYQASSDHRYLAKTRRRVVDRRRI